MKTNTTIAVLLIVIGIVALTYQGFSYTTKEKAIDIGPLQVTAEKTHTIPLPPVLGGLSLIGGIALLIAGLRNK